MPESACVGLPFARSVSFVIAPIEEVHLHQPFAVVLFVPLRFGCAVRYMTCCRQILSSELQSLGNSEKGLNVHWNFLQVPFPLPSVPKKGDTLGGGELSLGWIR